MKALKSIPKNNNTTQIHQYARKIKALQFKHTSLLEKTSKDLERVHQDEALICATSKQSIQQNVYHERPLGFFQTKIQLATL